MRVYLATPFLSALVLLGFVGCSNKATTPPAFPLRPATALESPVPLGACEAGAMRGQFEGVRLKQAARVSLLADVKNSPSNDNFRKLLAFDHDWANLAEQALVAISSCKEVPTEEIASLRTAAKTARDSILHLEESLPPGGR